jgi:hypothetical protein
MIQAREEGGRVGLVPVISNLTSFCEKNGQGCSREGVPRKASAEFQNR